MALVECFTYIAGLCDLTATGEKKRWQFCFFYKTRGMEQITSKLPYTVNSSQNYGHKRLFRNIQQESQEKDGAFLYSMSKKIPNTTCDFPVYLGWVSDFIIRNEYSTLCSLERMCDEREKEGSLAGETPPETSEGEC